MRECRWAVRRGRFEVEVMWRPTVLGVGVDLAYIVGMGARALLSLGPLQFAVFVWTSKR